MLTKDPKDVIHEASELEKYLAAHFEQEGTTFEQWISRFGEGTYSGRNRTILDLLRPLRPVRIFEFACAGGFLAKLLLENVDGIELYTCSNFSFPVVDHCRRLLPADKRCRFELVDANVRRSTDIERHHLSHYDTILTTSFEHIEHDRELITRFRSGSHFVFSVASFDDPEHFRAFENEKEIIDRYRDLLEILEIRPHDDGAKFVVSSTRLPS